MFKFRQHYTPLAQFIVSFFFGVLASPFGCTALWFVLYYSFFELLVAITWKRWDPFLRFSVVCVAILGWIIGRLAIGADHIWEELE